MDIIEPLEPLEPIDAIDTVYLEQQQQRHEGLYVYWTSDDCFAEQTSFRVEWDFLVKQCGFYRAQNDESELPAKNATFVLKVPGLEVDGYTMLCLYLMMTDATFVMYKKTMMRESELNTLLRICAYLDIHQLTSVLQKLLMSRLNNTNCVMKCTSTAGIEKLWGLYKIFHQHRMMKYWHQEMDQYTSVLFTIEKEKASGDKKRRRTPLSMNDDNDVMMRYTINLSEEYEMSQFDEVWQFVIQEHSVDDPLVPRSFYPDGRFTWDFICSVSKWLYVLLHAAMKSTQSVRVHSRVFSPDTSDTSAFAASSATFSSFASVEKTMNLSMHPDVMNPLKHPVLGSVNWWVTTKEEMLQNWNELQQNILPDLQHDWSFCSARCYVSGGMSLDCLRKRHLVEDSKAEQQCEQSSISMTPSQKVKHAMDIDLWIIGAKTKDRNILFNRILQALENKHGRVYFSVRNSVVTVIVPGFTRNIQLIYTAFESVSELFQQFDLTYIQSAIELATFTPIVSSQSVNDAIARKTTRSIYYSMYNIPVRHERYVKAREKGYETDEPAENNNSDSNAELNSKCVYVKKNEKDEQIRLLIQTIMSPIHILTSSEQVSAVFSYEGLSNIGKEYAATAAAAGKTDQYKGRTDSRIIQHPSVDLRLNLENIEPGHALSAFEHLPNLPSSITISRLLPALTIRLSNCTFPLGCRRSSGEGNNKPMMNLSSHVDMIMFENIGNQLSAHFDLPFQIVKSKEFRTIIVTVSETTQCISYDTGRTASLAHASRDGVQCVYCIVTIRGVLCKQNSASPSYYKVQIHLDRVVLK